MQAGFTAIEALIGIFAFAVLSLGTISLAVVGMRMVVDSERRVVALALVNERIEFIRSQPYELIDYTPIGSVRQVETDVQRNKQLYDLETQLTPTTDGLQKKIEVKASWLVPAGGRRDVQVVTLVSKSSPGSSEQVACTLTGTGFTATKKYGEASFVDDAFIQCKSNCAQSGQALWECCAWWVEETAYGFTPSSDVDLDCKCEQPPALSGYHATVDVGGYTDFSKKCWDGTLCGTDSAGLPITGRPMCDAGCLQGEGQCVCQC